MYVLEWRTVSVLTWWLFWCLFPELRSNEGNKYQNNTRVSTETVRHESTYITLFLTRHNESINDDATTIFTHRPRVSLARSLFCWWRHNRLLMTSQWLDNCDAITWIIISISLDTYYIHGDIHDRSCKNVVNLMHHVKDLSMATIEEAIWSHNFMTMNLLGFKIMFSTSCFWTKTTGFQLQVRYNETNIYNKMMYIYNNKYIKGYGNLL